MRIVLTGASGQLGSYLIQELIARDHEPIAWSGRETGHRAGIPLQPVDLTRLDELATTLEAVQPDAILHAAAMSTTDGVRLDPARARIVNVDATATLARWCARNDRKLLYTSTDLVFDGQNPWRKETDPAEPIVAYGRSKLDAEPFVLEGARHIAARVSLLYGPSQSGRPSFYDKILDQIRQGHSQTLFMDEFRTPLPYSDAARTLVRLIESDFNGLIHVGGPDRLSRYELMRRAAVTENLDPDLIQGNRQADVNFPEPRPVDVSLDCSRLHALGSAFV